MKKIIAFLSSPFIEIQQRGYATISSDGVRSILGMTKEAFARWAFSLKETIEDQGRKFPFNPPVTSAQRIIADLIVDEALTEPISRLITYLEAQLGVTEKDKTILTYSSVTCNPEGAIPRLKVHRDADTIGEDKSRRYHRTLRYVCILQIQNNLDIKHQRFQLDESEERPKMSFLTQDAFMEDVALLITDEQNFPSQYHGVTEGCVRDKKKPGNRVTLLMRVYKAVKPADEQHAVPLL